MIQTPFSCCTISPPASRSSHHLTPPSAAASQTYLLSLTPSPLISAYVTFISHHEASKEDVGEQKLKEREEKSWVGREGLPSAGALPFLPGEGADTCTSPGAFVQPLCTLAKLHVFSRCGVRGGFSFRLLLTRSSGFEAVLKRLCDSAPVSD